jgi:hypothetical protein
MPYHLKGKDVVLSSSAERKMQSKTLPYAKEGSSVQVVLLALIIKFIKL